MNRYFCSILFVLTGCQALPQLFQNVEQMADDNAIKIEVQKEAIQKETDINITVQVTNKDLPK